jgi:Tol biopolymer transport system component
VRALYVVFAVLVAAVVLTSGTAYSLLSRPPAFPIPVANITVTLPQGVPYRQLTTGSWNDRYPAWSPNGKSIAYVSDRGGLQALWIMDASGLHQRQLSYGSEMVACPSWSPDSSKIAFWALDGQTSEIRVFRLSDNLTLSVPGSGPDSVQASASWSPDSSRLAFFVRSGVPQLMVFDLNTGVSTSVANVNGSQLGVSWAANDRLLYSTSVGGYGQILWLNISSGANGVFMSGDGSFVTPAANVNDTWAAFYSDIIPEDNAMSPSAGFGGYEIYVCEGDGSNLTFQYVMSAGSYRSGPLFPTPLIPGVIDLSAAPAWSGDGTKILYASLDPLVGNHLYIWNVANWTTTMLPYVGSNDQDPSWSPDNVNAAFSCDLGGFYHIWVINTASSGMATASGGY